MKPICHPYSTHSNHMPWLTMHPFLLTSPSFSHLTVLYHFQYRVLVRFLHTTDESIGFMAFHWFRFRLASSAPGSMLHFLFLRLTSPARISATHDVLIPSFLGRDPPTPQISTLHIDWGFLAHKYCCHSTQFGSRVFHDQPLTPILDLSFQGRKNC